jgi:hypothetical protein
MAVQNVEDVFLPEQLKALNGKLIPAKAWAALRDKCMGADMLEVDEKGFSFRTFDPRGKVFYDFVAEQFPDWVRIVPTDIAGFTPVPGIGVNVEFLKTLCEAIGIRAGEARLIFTSQSKAMLLKSDEYDAFGLIMPVMCSLTETERIEDIKAIIGSRFITPSLEILPKNG